MRAALALVALVCAVSCAANPPINIAFHWHMHQPIYYPYESVVTTIDNNRFSYSLLDIFNSRSGPYTSWPIDAIQTAVSGGLNHCGAQVSFSGALQENLLNLQNSSLTGSFSTWQQRWQFAASNLFTSLKNPAVYLTAFGYHHPMMPLTDPFFVTLQILLHRHAIQSVLLPHQAPNADLMTGLFPPENAFSERIIPALLKAGIKWVLVDNIHFDRAHTNYPWTSGENLYAYKKVNASVAIVGWFSTGFDIPNTSCLIHEYYSRETRSPIHVTVDTTLRNNRPETKAYCSMEIGVPSRKQGSLFVPIPVEVITYEPERLAIELIQDGKTTTKRVVKPGMDLTRTKLALDDMYLMLTSLLEYVDKIQAGKINMDSNVGRNLMKIIDAVPTLDLETFDTLMTNQMNDLLMVSYLSNMVKVQLSLNEKLANL